jgi:signal transduction histidine kinase
LNISKDKFLLNDLIDDVFNVAEVNNGKNKLKYRLVNQLNEVNLVINSDKQRIKQILTNLMNNAYKFTTTGVIELGVSKKHNVLEFYVNDTGIGISNDNLPHVFDRFRKLEDNRNRIFRGAGLGLTISKNLAQKLGGNLYAESEIGVGSTFYYTLPLD